MSAPLAEARRTGLLAGLVVAVLPLLLFWRLFAPTAADRAHIVEGDLSSQYFPLRAYAAQRLADGELPLWSPNLFGGQPALADIQSAVLYPPNLVWSLARGANLTLTDLALQAVMHMSLAALGAYFLGRRLTGSAVGGAVTGAAFSLGGYLTSFPVQQLTILCTVAWLPWLLLVVDRLLGPGTSPARNAATLAAFTALAVLAGHPQTAMLCAYAVAGYVVWIWYWRRPSKRRVAAAMAGALLGIGLAAVQLLPTLEFIRLSVRSSLGFGQAGGGFGLHELSGLLYPGYFGGTPQYAGVVTLLLAAWAAATVAWRRTGYWLGLALAGVRGSFGGATFIGPLTYLLLPGFSTSRNQERAILWLALGLAILAGMGAARLAATATDDRRAVQARRVLWWTFAACVLVAGIMLGGARLSPPESGINLFGGFLKQHVWLTAGVGLTALWWDWASRRAISTRWFLAAVALLLVLNLASVNGRYHLGKPSPGETRPSAALAGRIQTGLGPGGRAASGGLLPEGPNAGILYGFADLTGNTPLRLQAYAQFQERVPEWVQWQLLAVSQVVLPAGVDPGPGLAQVQPDEPSLYRVVDPAPSVRLVHEVRPVAGEAVWEALAAPGHDPTTAAVVAPDTPSIVEPAKGEDRVSDLTWQPERISVIVTARSPALAVFSLIAYPGWRATVDGAPADWITVDGLLVGVPVANGAHRVQLDYRPASLYLGGAVTALSLLLTGLLFLPIGPLRRWESAQ